MTPYPPQLKLEAWRLYRAGRTAAQISRELDIPPNTILRWLNPATAERHRIASRERKRAIKGSCEICGGVTKCCRPGSSLPSRICQNCARRVQKKKWTRERVLAAIQEWERRRGRPPVSTEWRSSQRDPDGFQYPSRTSVYRSQSRSSAPFASWAEAIEAAGFPRPVIGRKRTDLPKLPSTTPRTAAQRREYRIAALRRALAKEERQQQKETSDKLPLLSNHSYSG